MSNARLDYFEAEAKAKAKVRPRPMLAPMFKHDLTKPCPRGLAQYAAGLNGCLCIALGSIPRADQVIWVKIVSTFALRLISGTGKRVRRCPL